MLGLYEPLRELALATAVASVTTVATVSFADLSWTGAVPPLTVVVALGIVIGLSTAASP
jgi:hypothetical protein